MALIANEEGETYLDAIYKHLSESKVNKDAIKSLREYISSEEYCTESVDFDINDSDSNISLHVQNTKCIQSIIDFMAFSRRMFL